MLDLLGNPPLFTLTVFILCLLAFIAENLFKGGVGLLCLSPSRVVTRLELYRIFTFPFIHGSFFHILFNMITWMYLSRDFERTTGTFAAIYANVMLLIPFTAVLHIASSFLIDAIAGSSFRLSCSLGISGILFSLLVVSLEASPSDAVSIFGLFNMPKRWYPLVLAALLQLFAPSLSLLAHLSGIFMGYAISLGYLTRLIPSDYKFTRLEERLNLKSLPLWQSVGAASAGLVYGGSIRRSNDDSETGFMASVRSWWANLTSRFSSNSETREDNVFSGQGFTLGGVTQPSPVAQAPTAGRVPLTSRLIREAELGTSNSVQRDQLAQASIPVEHEGE